MQRADREIVTPLSPAGFGVAAELVIRIKEENVNKRKILPRHCLTVATYDELRQLVRAFACGSYELLCITGGPGLGKSEIVKRIMQETRGALGWGLVKGKHTPLDLYERLYSFRRIPVVMDDLDDLLTRKENVILLKCVCDTHPTKLVAWGSKHWALTSGELPKSFESVSRICLICNDYDTLDRNIAAVYDRGLLISFQPSALELHRQVAQGGWFDDEEVFDFIGRNLFSIVEPSFRFYITAREHKKAGSAWRDLILRTIEAEADPKQILVLRLLADPQYETEAARVQAFKGHPDGGSKATYHRHKAVLLARRGNFNQADAATTKLQPSKPDLHYLAQLDRRRQIEQVGDQADDLRSGDSGNRADGQPQLTADSLSHLHGEMQKAIAEEKYELAAKLREKIRLIENGPEGQEK